MTKAQGNPDVSNDQADLQADEKAFDRLHSVSWELVKLFPEYQFRFSAALGIVLGWILTSADTQAFIAANRLLSRSGALTISVMLVIFHSVWVWNHARQLATLREALEKIRRRLKSAPEALMAGPRLVDGFLPVSYLLVNVALCTAIFLVTLSI